MKREISFSDKMEAVLKVITLFFLLILFMATFIPLIICSDISSWGKVILTLILNSVLGYLIVGRMFSIMIEVRGD